MMREMQHCAERLDLRDRHDPGGAHRDHLRLGNFTRRCSPTCEAGRPLELAPQLGAVVEIAGLLGVAAPFSRSILGLTRLISR